VIAQINEHAILKLEAPVLRVASPDTVLGFQQIEDEWMPDASRVVKAINQVLDF
jgi:pyruvate dehydrogenase E1 component beta subunit